MAAEILIVDDDPDVRELLREALETTGRTVVDAENGAEALALLTATPGLRLVLLDLRMPIMTGWEFLEAKAKLPEWAELPVVVLSATDPDPSLLARVAGFLKKPFDLDELLTLVARWPA